jgi:DNA-binding transcriptional regulator/RsmH inhibitor MraZ
MKVDAKGRVAIPSRFLPKLRAKNSGPAEPFGMIISPERSIRIMPYPLYLEEVEYWSGLDDRLENDRLIKNMVLSTADEGVLDAQNRIRLNAETMRLC